MSLRPQEVSPIPEETIRVAHAVFPKGNVLMRLRDLLGPIYTDAQFTALFPHDGQPALSPGRLALVSVLQFAEGLSDRQAAHAVRNQIDWKYALALKLDDPGFDASVLCEFRSRLLAGGAAMQLFETLLILLREQGFLKSRGKQRTDSTHVLAAVVTLNRLECVGETLRHARSAVGDCCSRLAWDAGSFVMV
jgi:transposase